MDDPFGAQLESGKKRKLTEHHMAGNILTIIFLNVLVYNPDLLYLFGPLLHFRFRTQ